MKHLAAQFSLALPGGEPFNLITQVEPDPQAVARERDAQRRAARAFKSRQQDSLLSGWDVETQPGISGEWHIARRA